MSRIRATSESAGRPAFDVDVPASGYRWWYIDGVSEDGLDALVVIAFIGSVFSPYYFRQRQRGPADPLDFCAINVGLYRQRGKRWSMTERGRPAVARGSEFFEVGPSRLVWSGDRLDIHIHERCAPFGQALDGRISLHPEMRNERVFSLDESARHTWQPFAPAARIDVAMKSPSLNWQGHGYFDTNAGSRALEYDFSCWNWSRGRRPDGTEITYAVTTTDTAERELAVRFGPDGTIEDLGVPPPCALPRTGWRVHREARAAPSSRILRTLEDTPFYARSLLDTGAGQIVMHESLDLARFRSAWVRTLLPFRRATRATRLSAPKPA